MKRIPNYKARVRAVELKAIKKREEQRKLDHAEEIFAQCSRSNSRDNFQQKVVLVGRSWGASHARNMQQMPATKKQNITDIYTSFTGGR